MFLRNIETKCINIFVGISTNSLLMEENLLNVFLFHDMLKILGDENIIFHLSKRDKAPLNFLCETFFLFYKKICVSA